LKLNESLTLRGPVDAESSMAGAYVR